MKRRNRRGDPQRQAYWQAVVRRWKESGRSVRDYCRAEGLRESAFFFWRRKLARCSPPAVAAGEPTSQPCPPAVVAPLPQRRRGTRVVGRAGRSLPSFLPVRVVSPAVEGHAGGLEIALTGGRILRVRPGFDRQTLTDVLAVLEGRPC
jgi:transposase-like protein